MADKTIEDHRQHLDYPCWIVAKSAQDRDISARISAISKSGARLTTEHPDSVPEEFVLNLTEDGLVRRVCRIAWRATGEIGIVFVNKNERVKLAAKPAERDSHIEITPSRRPS